MLGDKLVKDSLEFRCVFADRPADLRSRAQRQLRAKLDLGQDHGPEFGFPVVDYNKAQQSGRDHLHHILVLEFVAYERQSHLWLAYLTEALIQSAQAFVVAARLAHMDF